MSNAPLMPKATAVWLVENTALTFRQIADYCNLHELEVKGTWTGRSPEVTRCSTCFSLSGGFIPHTRSPIALAAKMCHWCRQL